MGCLPGLILFLLATTVGWWLGGNDGVMWGALVGLAAGVVATVTMILVLRRATHGGAAGQDGSAMEKEDQ